MNESLDELKSDAKELASRMAEGIKAGSLTAAQFIAAASAASGIAAVAEPRDIADEAKSSRNSRRRRIRVGSTKCTAVNKDERERRNAKRKAALQARKRNRK